MGKAKVQKENPPRWGGGIPWGGLNGFVKTGDPSDVVIVVVVVVVVVEYYSFLRIIVVDVV